jgi:hypothetical protein
MRFLQFIFPILSAVLLTGCVEIIDDLTLNSDGSGSFKYNVNLSSSKIKINYILALDSLDGKRVPSLDEMKQKITSLHEKLKLQPGISNAKLEADYTNFIFKFSCDFASIEDLQYAIKLIAISENKGKPIPELDHKWLIFSGTHLERSVPKITLKKSKQITAKDQLKLKEGTYTSITRFDKEIRAFNNDSAKLSTNKKAIMLRTDTYSLVQNPRLLDNLIDLKQ